MRRSKLEHESQRRSAAGHVSNVPSAVGADLNLLHRRFSGAWSRNPWINAPHSHSQRRPADVDEERWLHKAAIGVWEGEGGSIRSSSKSQQ
jgi:hypothetical protein